MDRSIAPSVKPSATTKRATAEMPAAEATASEMTCGGGRAKSGEDTGAC